MIDYIIFGLYFVAVLFIGCKAGQKTDDTDSEVHVVGRKSSSIIAALSSSASTESGFVLLGMVGAGYALGVSAMWIIAAGILAYLLLWVVLANQIRQNAAARDVVTAPEYIAVGSSANLRSAILLLAGLISVAFLIAYTAAQFNAAGKAFDAQFNLGFTTAVLISAIVVSTYILVGSFRTSLWTDIPPSAADVVCNNYFASSCHHIKRRPLRAFCEAQQHRSKLDRLIWWCDSDQRHLGCRNVGSFGARLSGTASRYI